METFLSGCCLSKVPASLFDFNLPIAPSTTLAFAPNINAEFSSVKPPRAISFALKSSAKTDVAISGVIIFSEPKLKEFSGAKIDFTNFCFNSSWKKDSIVLLNH